MAKYGKQNKSPLENMFNPSLHLCTFQIKHFEDEKEKPRGT